MSKTMMARRKQVGGNDVTTAAAGKFGKKRPGLGLGLGSRSANQKVSYQWLQTKKN